MASECVDFLLSDMAQGKGLSHKSMVKNFDRIIDRFKAIPVTGEEKVRVGVVGEIYVKYAPLGNNNLNEFLLSEGAEPVVPGLVTSSSSKSTTGTWTWTSTAASGSSRSSVKYSLATSKSISAL